jgi:spermidine synthase
MNELTFSAGSRKGINANLLIFLVGGFAALAYQVVSFKLISIAGLSDATSVAVSLTAFVALAAFGALASERIPSSKAAGVEVLLGIYALVVFGGIQLAGVESAFLLLGGLSVAAKLVGFIAIIGPIAFASGALIPIHQNRTTVAEGHSDFLSFKPVYVFFHIGGAASLLFIEWYGFPVLGWPAVGCLIALASILNGCAVTLVQPGTPRQPGVARRPGVSGKRLIAGLALLSILTGYFGISSYKAFDYLLGPNLRNYSTVTALIFLGLSLSAVIAAKVTLTFRGIAGLSGLGILLFYLAIYTSGPITTFFLSEGLDSWLLYFVLGALLLVPAYALIGLSIPSSIKMGVKTEHALFVVSIGNAIGYWLFVVISQMNVDAVILLASAFACVVLSDRRVRLVSIPLAIVIAFLLLPLKYSATHHLILAQKTLNDFKILEDNVYIPQRLSLSEPVEVADIPEFDYEFKILESWSRYGWTTDHVRLNGWDGDRLILSEDYLVIDGFVSLEMSDPSRTIYAESMAAALPALFATRKERALVLGGGTGVSAALIAETFDSTTLVDISPDTESQLDYFEPLNGDVASKVTLIKSDALSFVSKTSRDNSRYDLIFSTVTGAGYQFSAMLYTNEFFRVVRQSLSDGGVFAFWMDDRFDYDTGAPQILAAMSEQFEYVTRYTVYPDKGNDELLVMDADDELPTYPNMLPYQVVIGSQRPLIVNADSSAEIVRAMSDRRSSVDLFSSQTPDTREYLDATAILSERRVFDALDGVGNAAVSNMSTLNFAYHYLMSYQRTEQVISDFREYGRF